MLKYRLAARDFGIGVAIPRMEKLRSLDLGISSTRAILLSGRLIYQISSPYLEVVQLFVTYPNPALLDVFRWDSIDSALSDATFFPCLKQVNWVVTWIRGQAAEYSIEEIRAALPRIEAKGILTTEMHSGQSFMSYWSNPSRKPPAYIE